MTVKRDALAAVDSHWAIDAFGTDRALSARRMADEEFVAQSVGGVATAIGSEQAIDWSTIQLLADAYEVVAIEGIDDLRLGAQSALADQCAAAAYRAYELLRVLPVPDAFDGYSHHILHIASIAYCGDRAAEFKAWLSNAPQIPDSSTEDGWDLDVLRELTAVWITLVRKDGWDDLDSIAASIASLRHLQEDRELALFAAVPDVERPARAWRLVALYHWAKATEQLARYVLQGEPADIRAELSFHFERSSLAAMSAGDLTLDLLLKWLHVAANMMVRGSFWSMASATPSARRLVSEVTRRSMFEMLPPQRIAIQEAGLLDPASAAVVIDLPTSSGKTVLAEFKILQALEQHQAAEGWIAYVAPTRALVAQITRRLRSDLGPLGIGVEHLSSAIDVDQLEADLLNDTAERFDVLVTTPEKLHLAIRSGSIDRPLALVVLDEAHNIEDDERGVRIELTLATIKHDYPDARFLLLTPFVQNATEVARWLAPDSGKSISLSTSPWKPNERLIGSVSVAPPASGRGRDWRTVFSPLITSDEALHVEPSYRLGDQPQFDRTYSNTRSNLSIIAAAAARQLSERGTSVMVTPTIDSCWTAANEVAASLPGDLDNDEDVALVRRFVASEIGSDFALADLLNHGVGVHHAGMSDDARALVEWLAESGKLRVLCATSTITQGINFPVSSILLASTNVPSRGFSRPMSPREFWNLAGRAGRVDQQNLGIVGISSRGAEDDAKIASFLAESTGDLVSQLVQLIEEIAAEGQLLDLESWIYRDQWADFRSFVAHMVRQVSDLETLSSETESLLRNTFGYTRLQARSDAQPLRQALLNATRSYASQLAEKPGRAALADNTGFSPETVGSAIGGLRSLDSHLAAADWQPASIFGSGSRLPDLVGVMLKMPQLRSQMEDLVRGGGDPGVRIAEMARDWVGGKSIAEIATKYFADAPDDTKAMTQACRAIFRNLANSATWGLSALVQLPGSGVDFETLTDPERRQLGLIGAMVYHGVSSEEAVVMRMNDVPRSIAQSVGQGFISSLDSDTPPTVWRGRRYLAQLTPSEWAQHRPPTSALSGSDYQRVWSVLSGGAKDPASP